MAVDAVQIHLVVPGDLIAALTARVHRAGAPRLCAAGRGRRWASGLRVYAVVRFTGLAGALGWVERDMVKKILIANRNDDGRSPARRCHMACCA